MPSRSASSTPSEGEIRESDLRGRDSPTSLKATTKSHTFSKDSSVDRRTRTVSKPSRENTSRSPAHTSSTYRRSSRSRSRSRSPYHNGSRGEKRRRDDDYYQHGRGYGRNDRDYGYRSHRDDYDSQRRRPYHDYDREATSVNSLRYNDDYDTDRRQEQRQRTRSRSPYRHDKLRKTSRYDSREEDRSRRDRGGEGGLKAAFVPASNQSVSERGRNPGSARHQRHEAETRGYQNRTQDTAADKGDSLESAHANNGDNAEPKVLDEATLIEERRKRREALKARLKGQSTPSLLVQALQINTPTGSSTPAGGADSSRVGTESPREQSPALTPGPQSPMDVSFSKDEDIVNATSNGGDAHTDEPSAADYDPTLDMQEDSLKKELQDQAHDVSASAYDETKTSKQDVMLPSGPGQQEPASVKPADGFDMFADDDDDMFAEAPEKATAEDQGPTQTAPLPRELDVGMLDNWDDAEGYYNVRLGELIDGRYHIQQNLGRGMFSSVVRAIDNKTGETCAIKIIRNNDTMRKAALKEITILNQLRAADPEDKKHLIKFERTFEHKGHVCMVFENLSMNLREVLKKFGRDVGINLKAIRLYAQQLFLGLSLMRKCDILHADLKPDNILLNDSRNLLKICDLGSASFASDESEITPYLVSRFYRAPEIILGIPYDFAIDVWSIGCTLFELYTGKILFTGRTNNQMLRSIQECRGRFPQRLLRKGSLAPLHFDDLLNFQSYEEDKITGRVMTKVLDFKKPTRDLKTRLVGKGSADATAVDAKELSLFMDLLDRCLSLNPEKRITPSEALKHPFILRMK